MHANKRGYTFEVNAKGNVIISMNDKEVQLFNNLVHMITRYEQRIGKMISQRYNKGLYLMLTLGYVCYTVEPKRNENESIVFLVSMELVRDTLMEHGYVWSSEVNSWVYIGKVS